MPSHKIRFSHLGTAQFRLQFAKVLDIQHVHRIRDCQLTTIKTIAVLRVSRAAGIAKPGTINERKFSEAAKVSKETVPSRGGAGHLSRGMP